MHGDLDILSKIRTALDNPLWDFRTVNGIAKESGLGEDIIVELLETNTDLFRKLPVKDDKGRNLFTLASHPIRWKERLAVLQGILGGRLSLSS